MYGVFNSPYHLFPELSRCTVVMSAWPTMTYILFIEYFTSVEFKNVPTLKRRRPFPWIQGIEKTKLVVVSRRKAVGLLDTALCFKNAELGITM